MRFVPRQHDVTLAAAPLVEELPPPLPSPGPRAELVDHLRQGQRRREDLCWELAELGAPELAQPWGASAAMPRPVFNCGTGMDQRSSETEPDLSHAAKEGSPPVAIASALDLGLDFLDHKGTTHELNEIPQDFLDQMGSSRELAKIWQDFLDQMGTSKEPIEIPQDFLDQMGASQELAKIWQDFLDQMGTSQELTESASSQEPPQLRAPSESGRRPGGLVSRRWRLRSDGLETTRRWPCPSALSENLARHMAARPTTASEVQECEGSPRRGRSPRPRSRPPSSQDEGPRCGAPGAVGPPCSRSERTRSPQGGALQGAGLGSSQHCAALTLELSITAQTLQDGLNADVGVDEDAPSEDSPSEAAPSEAAPSEDAPSEDTPSERGAERVWQVPAPPLRRMGARAFEPEAPDGRSGRAWGLGRLLRPAPWEAGSAQPVPGRAGTGYANKSCSPVSPQRGRERDG